MHNLKSFFALLFVTATFLAAAQPQKVNYQAVALTAGGQTVKNQAIILRLSIVDSSATGTVLYTETHQPTTDGAGQFSVFLGGGTANLGSFSNIFWGNGNDKFLKAEADVTGGTNYMLMGTSQIVSVPYAIAAGSLTEGATITGANGSQYTLTVGANGPTWNLTNPNVNFNCGQALTYAGESYPTVQIGNQCWFQKNLNVGTMILGANDQTNNSILEKYCYNNDPANCAIYGGLYQWAEAVQYQNGASNTAFPSPAFSGNVKGMCLTGWHVPSNSEWDALEAYLGGPRASVGGVLKSTNGLWSPPNTGASNSSGFSSLPSGYRDNGTFFDLSRYTYFWSSSEFISTNAFSHYLTFVDPSFFQNLNYKYNGYSVRCLKD